MSETAEELIRLGGERDDARLECRGRLQAMWARTSTDPSVTTEEMQATAEAAIPILEDAGDEAGLARAYQLLGASHHFQNRTNRHLEGLERALDYARRAGDTAHEAEITSWLAVAYYFGPTPIDQVEARLEQILAEARAKELRSHEGIMLGFLGGVEGLRGRFDEARDLFRRSRAILTDIGLQTWVAGQTQVSGHIEILAGDYAAAERELRFGSDELERMGETGIRSLNVAMLAEALYEQGRDDEAEHYVDESRHTAAADDYASQLAWHTVAARLLARRGQLDESERVAREALDFVDEDGGLFDPYAWATLGETLAVAGKRADAEHAFAQALWLTEQQGNIAGAARIRDLAARVDIRPQ
jgi:tetratricopeptide (TPR) repeat protein